MPQPGLILAKIIKPLHSLFIFKKRIRVLGKHISRLIPANIRLRGLDVGCGGGELAAELQSKRDNINMDGVEVLLRKEVQINITTFDGKILPFGNKTYDFVLLIDVLHHANNPIILLQECVRVGCRFIIIKDHICDSQWDRMCLSFRDWVGNRAANVCLPNNFLSSEMWETIY
ncbi:MAG: class I SAM-dependent methyltransferase, partial [Nitrospirae bacterium]|nr:class I SAM-dependent methyltransferase [Nitrospirota bacterium]